MEKFIDSTGLALFKSKQDLANTEKFAQKTDIKTKTSELENDSEFQNATQVSEAISAKLGSVYTYKGSVVSKDKLPSDDNTTGDVYDVQDTGMNYAWDGTEWDALGMIIEIDASLSSTSANPVQNKVVKEALDGKASTAEVTDNADGLMTPEMKKKLDGIEEGASVYTDFTGATSADAGTAGLVPAPASGKTDALLCSDGTWVGPMTTAEIEALFK